MEDTEEYWGIKKLWTLWRRKDLIMITMIKVIFPFFFICILKKLCRVLLSYYLHFTDGKQRLKEHKQLDSVLPAGRNHVGLQH